MKLRGSLERLEADGGGSRVTLGVGTAPAELEKFRDKELDIDIKAHRNRRSLDANACLWACINDLAGALGLSNWETYLAELKAYGRYATLYMLPEAYPEMARHWRETDVVGSTEQVGIDGSVTEMLVVNCYYGSHTYDSKEFSVLLDGVIQDMKGQGLDTPPSEDMRRMLEEMEAKDARLAKKDEVQRKEDRG